MSSLEGGANLASVQGIALEFRHTPASLGSFLVDSFSVVSEPTGNLPPKKVVAEGDTLDNDTLAAFEGQGEVAISAGQSGDMVAFHGLAETGEKDTAAVWTQGGVVAKVGDLLDDGDTLNDIWTYGGVAINPYGFGVAFHGRIDTTDAVFVGEARLLTARNRPASDIPRASRSLARRDGVAALPQRCKRRMASESRRQG